MFSLTLIYRVRKLNLSGADVDGSYLDSKYKKLLAEGVSVLYWTSLLHHLKALILFKYRLKHYHFYLVAVTILFVV